MSDDRAEWLEWRRHGIGASDIPKLVGLSNHGTPWTVFANKLGLLPDTDPTPRQRLGLRLERFIGEEFSAQTGLYVAGEQTRCEKLGDEWMRCTVDFLAYEHGWYGYPDEPGVEPLGPVQAKTDARYGPWKAIPDDMMAQVQWELAVTGATGGWLAVFHGNMRVDIYPIERHDRDIAYMISVARTFWHDHVLTGTPPPLTGTDTELDALAAIWPDTLEGKTVALDCDVVDEWRFRREERLAAERDEKSAKAAMLAALADAEVGTVDGEPAVTYRTVTRAGYTVEPTTYRQLRDARKAESGS